MFMQIYGTGNEEPFVPNGTKLKHYCYVSVKLWTSLTKTESEALFGDYFRKILDLANQFYAISVKRIPNQTLISVLILQRICAIKINGMCRISLSEGCQNLFCSNHQPTLTEPKKTLIAVFVVLVEANCSYQSLC
jgi:hypothetical protein